MSEKLIPKGEGSVEAIDTSEESERNLKRLEKAAHEAAHETKEELGSLETKAKAEAISGAETSVGEHESGHSDTPTHSTKQLKQAAYERGLERIQSNLSAPEKVFSKIVHKPAIETISNVGAHTLARPAGLFGGALMALIGSLGLSYMTRHYGFRYNYLFFVFLFVAGYAAGLVAEALVKLARKLTS